jgi:hypothetical protein
LIRKTAHLLSHIAIFHITINQIYDKYRFVDIFNLNPTIAQGGQDVLWY